MVGRLLRSVKTIYYKHICFKYVLTSIDNCLAVGKIKGQRYGGEVINSNFGLNCILEAVHYVVMERMVKGGDELTEQEASLSLRPLDKANQLLINHHEITQSLS